MRSLHRYSQHDLQQKQFHSAPGYQAQCIANLIQDLSSFRTLVSSYHKGQIADARLVQQQLQGDEPLPHEMNTQ